ncbi:hypothetical protein [Desulfobacula phenolica]|uniref:O-antigen ligase like membrane protein n=1 Tax=Desulfobacula phenolica TaxID=90732 RepID=A0A1H2DTY8_9BACT|nr:hypothetical protein [Desulfobacula phenolica]SDT86244.1 hypothetical protein SAMN04487931_102177 [Desulfobacula phenolica]
MINSLLYLLITSIFILDWLFFRYGIGVRQITWLPEFISIVIAVSIPFKMAIIKQTHIPIKYTFLLFLYIANLLVGFFLNDVSAWTMLSGLRIYTKFIPVFLLPLIFPFSTQDFKKITIIIFILAMIQFPIVLWQRFVEFSTKGGDPVGGTLGVHASGVLSIFLLIIISFLIAFYFKKKISLPIFLLSFAASFIPTTLNETKITFLLLPITMIFPAIFIKDIKKTIFRIMLVILILVASFFILKGIYNHFQSQTWGYGIETFVTMPGRVAHYNRKRIDPIKNSIKNAVKDIRFLFFGRGAGNVSEGFTKKLNGKYVREGIYYGAKSVSFTKLMWEIGTMGIVLIYSFLFFVFLDSSKLCKKDDFSGAFSLGMLSFSMFFFLSMFYTETLEQNIFVYIFFLAAGQIAYLHDSKKSIETVI